MSSLRGHDCDTIFQYLVINIPLLKVPINVLAPFLNSVSTCVPYRGKLLAHLDSCTVDTCLCCAIQLRWWHRSGVWKFPEEWKSGYFTEILTNWILDGLK